MSYTNATPVLRVSDYQRARAFYTDILGFEVMEEAGEPIVGFGILRAGAAQVFLMAWDGPEAEYKRWRVYLYPQDLDARLAQIAEAGGTHTGPVVTEYGMREAEVTDPDGNVICLGEDAG
ncbi:VOC family protein [Tateyamaria armeniaca]|uniref:VOC family protein n=1 Tax=Tateyamaria armeniaca TaxID=2518930 RepID=A0ABW8V3C4_9RHOB